MTDREIQAALDSLQKTMLETLEALQLARARIAILETENATLRLAMAAMPRGRKGAHA